MSEKVLETRSPRGSLTDSWPPLCTPPRWEGGRQEAADGGSTSPPGVPQPSITWYKDAAVVEVARLSRFRQRGDGGLQVSGLVPDDTGMFQCFARNTAGEVQTSTYLAVTSKSCPVLPWSPSHPGRSSALSQGPLENRDRIPEHCPSAVARVTRATYAHWSHSPTSSAWGGLRSLHILPVSWDQEQGPWRFERSSGISDVAVPSRAGWRDPNQPLNLSSQLANPILPESLLG